MGLFSGLFAGRESLMSHGTALAAIADNLANTNTPGFKANRAEFSDLLASSMGTMLGDPLDTGDGVAVTQISTMHGQQGSMDVTDNDLDFGIQGNGYFVVSNETDNFYTRAGNFQTDKNGDIVSRDGQFLMGFTAASPTTLTKLSVNDVAATATPSTTGALTGNLDVTSAITDPTGLTTYEQLTSTANYNSTISVIDSLGERHDVSLYFFHSEQLGWTTQAYVDGADTGGTAGTPTLVGTGTMTFSDTGQQTAGATTPLAISIPWANGAAASAVNVDMSGISSLAGNSTFASVTMDGVRPGQINGFELSSDGTLLGSLDTGETVEIGTVPLAIFNNPYGLQKLGSNLFSQTETSGDASVGAAKIEGRGSLSSGNLENSTVDPANEFVTMIRYQRGYEAGSKVITAINDIVEKTLNIV